MSRTLIAGAGLAGLACARELGADCTVLEAEDRAGGLIRTDLVDGFSFDWTGHWLHARDPQMKALIRERWLAGNLLEIQRRAVIYSEGCWTAFPYQFNLHGLPPATIEECLTGFVEATLGEPGRELRERPLRNAAEFILRHLGAGFARRFMFPYNEKLYTVPCEELSPEWGGRFIPRPSLREVIRGAVGFASEAGYNASFWYPREGGIESLARGLLRDVRAEIRFGTRIERISLRERTVTAGGRTEPFDKLVWTAPLPLAVRLAFDAPPEVQEAAASLRAVSVTVVEIGARDRAEGQRFHWAYFPEKELRFYRVGSPSEVNPALAPRGMRSFAVEFAHGVQKVNPDSLLEDAIQGLEKVGLLRRSEVVLARARTIPTAYVLFDHAHEQARRTVVEHLRANGVIPAGRYGNWEYSSMEDALLSGQAAARAT